ncbi:hypothetical protein [Nonomuraea sp. NPDC048826]|uniref:hypothetical protein n=1 Tax=Nonomuraea sp. NPDC048826 TaxID=3364347 RepID=UPI00371504DD
MSGLADVIATWLDGRTTTQMELWGLGIVWWGRIGKGLLFAGGLAVVIDLLDAGKLRAHGLLTKQRAKAAWDHAQNRSKESAIARLERTVWDDLVGSKILSGGMPHTAASIVILSYLYSEPPRRAPHGLDCSLQTYQDFHSSVTTALPNAHCHNAQDMDRLHPPKTRYMCVDQVAFVRARIEAFLAEQVPAEHHGLLGKSAKWLKIKALWWFLRGGAERLAGWALYRQRPLHMLRWAAFVFVVVGGLLDMLAS